MTAQLSAERERTRERLFTRMASTFARHDFESLEGDVVPDVELTLRGSSWLAGKYRGYEEFGHYVAGAALVLMPAGRQLSYIHEGNQTTVVHDFLVGERDHCKAMPLHIVLSFDTDDIIESMLIRPWDQSLFDEALNAFLA